MIRDLPTTIFFETFTALSRKKGLSPSMAAEDAGLNRSVITSWRKGRIPSTKTLDRLANYFGVTRQYLLDGLSVESETGSKVEPYEKMQDASEPTNVSSTDALEGGSRLESRSFVKFALGLLKIYCPDETDESLASQLKMSPNVFKALEDDGFDKVPVDADWRSRFYSLLEDKNVLQIWENLGHARNILKNQREKSISNKIPQVIWDYMYQKGLDFEFVKEENAYWYSHKYNSVIKLKDSGKHWVFCFTEITSNTPVSYRHFVQDNLKWNADIPDVERFVIMFMYTKNLVSDGELAEFEEGLCKAYPNEIRALLSNTQLFLHQISGITQEFMEEKQVDLSSFTDLCTD